MIAFKIPAIFSAIDKFTGPVGKMQSALQKFGETAEQRMTGIDRKMRPIGKAALVTGAAIAAPLALAARAATAFEDKLTDVGKTTGLQGAELEKFGSSILSMSGKTRTSIDDLVKIGEIGGQLGIAKGELLGFTDSVNKFNVALGKDFSGGVEEAATKIGNIKTLFKETRQIDIASSIQKAGSAINELGAVGSGTSANITDFTLRLGALPDALKPALSNTLALGTFLEELGIDAQIGAGGMTNFLLVAGKNIDGFASQMKISSVQAKALLSQDPTEFAKKFAVSLNGLAPDKLAKKLDDLKIGSQETIKVVGALGSGVGRLTELQNVASKAFQEGTSLQNEYNKKNENTAAKLAKARNNMEAFTILIGTQLLPMLGDLIQMVTPVIQRFVDWAKENPGITKTILKISLGVAALSFALAGVSGVIAIATKAMAVFNFIMAMNPIGLTVIAIVAMIGVITSVVIWWDKWGAAVALMLGPLGYVISLIQAFRTNWGMIVSSFKEDGILGGIIAIGKTLMDSVLYPVQQLLQLIGKITGLDLAATLGAKIASFRADLDLNSNEDEKKPVVNSDRTKQEVLQRTIEQKNQNVNIDIQDRTGSAKMKQDNYFVPVKLTSTMR